MPFVEERVELIVDGYAFTGWQSVSIERSMQNAAITFELAATNATWSDEAMSLRRGRKVEIRTSPASGASTPGGGDLMCIGYIDAYDADYAPGTKTVRISGRSKGADAVDCPPVKHKTGRVKNKTLVDVAKELDEFDIGFTSDVDDLKPIPKVQIEPGETLFATLDREAARQGVMLAGQPDGSIKVTRAGTKRHAGTLELGVSPVARMRVHVGSGHKRSPIVVRGQRGLGTGADALRQEVEELDATVERHRPIVVVLEGDAPKKELQQRAKWQRLRQAGFGTGVTAEVSTWRDDDGLIWDAGRLMAILAEAEDVDGDMTLSSVSFRQDLERGTTASLTFVDPKSHGGKKAAGTSDKVFDAGADIQSEGDE